MANHQYCVNGTTLEGNKYSAPVAIIGLYIAGGSLLCFLLIFCDIRAAWHQHKRWVPCSLFSLNSLTLSLLSIVAKLPVDLTSPMPSAFDQLSKLTGTTIICIYMAFFLPSIGTTGASECFSNIAALTIFVVTVIVNICIQIRTGVIFSLIVEHVIILCFMFLLLMLFWCCAVEVNARRGVYSGHIKKLLLEGKGFSMVQRLKLCYFYSYGLDQQFRVCRSRHGSTTGLVSVICTVVLSEAVIQSLLLKDIKFCQGHSDYRWSIRIVVVIQIVTVTLGFLVPLFRWVTVLPHVRHISYNMTFVRRRIFVQSGNFTGRGLVLAIYLFGFINNAVFYLSMPVVTVARRIMASMGISTLQGTDVNISTLQGRDVNAVTRFHDQLKASNILLAKGILANAVDDFNIWEKIIQIKYPSVGSLQVTRLLFRKFPPSHYQPPYRPSCLSVVLLVREVVKELGQVQLAESLKRSLDEVFGIICFIDKKINVLFFESKEKLDVAVKIQSVLRRDEVHSPSEEEDFNEFDSYVKEVDIIGRIVRSILQSSSDPEDKENQVQKLFIEMLNWFLYKLPKAILKDVVDSPPASYNDRLKVHLECIHILSSLENQVQWKFPSATDITSLIADNNSQETPQLIPEVEQDDATVGGASQRMEEGGASQQMEEGCASQRMEEGCASQRMEEGRMEEGGAS